MSFACPSIPIVPKLKHFSDEGKLGLVIPRKWLENDVFPHSRVIPGFGWPSNESNDKEWLGWGQSHSGRKSSFLGHFLIPDSFWDEWHENEWNDVTSFQIGKVLKKCVFFVWTFTGPLAPCHRPKICASAQFFITKCNLLFSFLEFESLAYETWVRQRML